MEDRMNHEDGTPKTPDELWLEEIIESGKSPSVIIAELQAEIDDPEADDEDKPWMEDAIQLLRRLEHS